MRVARGDAGRMAGCACGFPGDFPCRRLPHSTPYPPRPFPPSPGRKGELTAIFGLVFEGGTYTRLLALGQVTGWVCNDFDSAIAIFHGDYSLKMLKQLRPATTQPLKSLPNQPPTLHSPSLSNRAKYGCSAPSLAPAGAREGGGERGGT